MRGCIIRYFPPQVNTSMAFLPGSDANLTTGCMLDAVSGYDKTAMTSSAVTLARTSDGVSVLGGPGPPRQLSALSVSHSKSGLYSAFVWARRALNSPT
jgi:hypothetical protein